VPNRHEPKPDAIRRREAILGAAKKVFLEHGYELTSMDLIAKQAGTTKRTVYAHFKNKDALFAAMAHHGAQQFLDWLGDLNPNLPDYRRELERFATRYCELSTFRSAMLFQRTVIAESKRFANRKRDLSGAMSGRALAILARYLEDLDRRDILKVPNPILAATQFLDLTSASMRFATLFGAMAPLPDPQPDPRGPLKRLAHIRPAVDLFLRGYTRR